MSEKKLDGAKYHKKRSMEPLLELPDFVSDAPPPAMSATLDAGFRDVPLVDPDEEAAAEEEELGERPSLSALARQADTAALQAWRATIDHSNSAGVKPSPGPGSRSGSASGSGSGSGVNPSGPRSGSYYAAALADIRGGIRKGLKTGLQKGREEGGEDEDEDFIGLVNAEGGEDEDAKAPARGNSSSFRRKSSSSLSEDIETLAAKACALASTPIPDYAGTFARKDQKYKTKKYRDKDVQRAPREDDDPNSIRLAGKTSNILSDFQDYLEVIESQSEVDSILDYKPQNVATKTGGEERRGGVLTEWKWEDKFSDKPNYKRRGSRDRNLYTDDKCSYGDGDSVGSLGDEKKRYRYTHLLLHSKKFKVGALGVIVFVALLGAIIGVTSSGHKEDFEREYLDRVQGAKGRPVEGHSQQDVASQQGVETQVGNQQIDKGRQHESTPAQNDGAESPSNEQFNPSDLGLPAGDYKDNNKNQNKPPRAQNIGLPQGDNEGRNKSTPAHNDPSKEESNGDSTSSAVAAAVVPNAAPGNAQEGDAQKGDAQEGDGQQFQNKELAYQAAFEKYHALWYSRATGWEGKTYREAFEFCAEKERGICPFDAVCPLGPGTKPLGDYTDGLGKTWVPISGESNEWVNLSKEGSCVKYSSMHEHLPEWGATGEGSEGLTGTVMCCEVGVGDGTSSGQMPPAPSPSNEPVPAPAHPTTSLESAHKYQLTKEMTAAYGVAVKKYHPHRFDRAAGWEGATYLEAGKFCQGERRGMCPFDAVCPLGPGSLPFGGYLDGAEKVWVPISDGSNEWVNLSEEGPCTKYSSMYEHLPEWGVTGKGTEGLTHTILCCEVGVEESSSQTPPAPSPLNKPVPAPALPMTESAHKYHLTEEMTAGYKAAVEKYHPQGYDRAAGWEGTTYQDAVEFCESEHRLLCPFKAFCPLGMGTLPFGGYLDGETSWVPIADAANDWANLGNKSSCVKYSIMYVQPPEWGATGEGGEGIARHVWCCEDVGGEGPSLMATPEPSRSPTPAPTPPKANKVVPKWYHRSSGWTGRTYDEAFSFCAGQGLGYELCPYKSFCPVPNGVPSGGLREERSGVSWAPIGDSFNDWVQVGGDDICARYSTVHSSHPDWGLTGTDSEDFIRDIACCLMRNLGEGTVSSAVASTNMVVANENTASLILGTPEEDSTSEVAAPYNSSSSLDYPAIIEKYAPKWYHRYDGTEDEWFGNSYTDAIVHCAHRESSIPCPYEAYCPNGPGRTPFAGSPITPHAQKDIWAPIMDIPNGWVNVGSSPDSCKLYNSLHSRPPLWGLVGHRLEEEGSQLGEGNFKDMTAHIMCCREPPEGLGSLFQTSAPAGPVPVANTEFEQDILDKKHPLWFSRDRGYYGTTHDEAAEFCNNVGGMVLCPAETYCPEGNTDPDLLLFFQNPAFEGEQWVPVATTSTGSNKRWLQVGKVDGDSQSTCSTFGGVGELKPFDWDLDYANPEMKKHVMCCLNPNHLSKETNLAKDLDPIWLDESFGWKGGSHDDAEQFCKRLGANKKLCPYAAYCPHGPGQPVIGGHSNDFNLEGEQWAPVHRESNFWVMIGQKYGNSATTCMDSLELEGKEPSWGTSNDRADLKKHIMCCEL